MSVLSEKDPGFIKQSRIEGNLSVVTHPYNPNFYGDGSVAVDGTLSVDTVKSATPNSVVHLISPLVQHALSQRPSPPVAGQTMMYSDSASNDRLVMVDSTGTVIDLNPLRKVGDLMTFDAVKQTTVPFHRGLPEQVLQSDPNTNLNTGLAWKSRMATLGNLIGPSDETMRYIEVENSVLAALTVSAAPVQFVFDSVLRNDSDTYSISEGDIILASSGTFEILYKVTLKSNDSSDIQDGTLASAQIYFAKSDSADPTGYSHVPGSHVYSNFPLSTASSISSAETLTCRMVVNVTAGTHLRFFAQELTSTQVLKIAPWNAHVSISKLAWDADSAEFLTLQGVSGARPSLSTEFTALVTSTIMFRSNPADVVGADYAEFATAGFRVLFGKLSFATVDTPVDARVVIASQLQVLDDTGNDVSLSNSVAECTLLGANGHATVCINIMQQISAGYKVRIRSKIVSSTATVGSVVAIAEDCCVYALLPNTRKMDKFCATSSVSQVASPAAYADVLPGSVQQADDGYILQDAIVSVSNGGTMQYLLQATVDNNDDSKIYDGIVSLHVSSSPEGFLEVPSSRCCATLNPGTSKTVLSGGTMYLPPHSMIKARFLAPDGGNVSIQSNRFALQLISYERTTSSFVGQSNFGRFLQYVQDDQEVVSTSTEFALRLAAVASDLPGGKYRMGLSFEWDMNDSGIGFEAQMVVDDSIVVDSYSVVPVITGAYQKVTTFKQVDLVAGKHSFAFNTRVLNSSRALYTKDVRIEFWKI